MGQLIAAIEDIEVDFGSSSWTSARTRSRPTPVLDDNGQIVWDEAGNPS
jgi:hypothetical protein